MDAAKDDDILENEELPSSVSIYPDAKIRIAKEQYSISHLKTLVEKRKTLKIDPDFQRNNVWKSIQGSELVESVLMGIPIPVIYLYQAKNGIMQVVDGRQRITALLQYLNGKFALRDLKILHNLNDHRFSALDPVLQGLFEDYQLTFYIIQPPTPERVKYDIFDRVNRGGTKLTHQEMRNALYNGYITKALKEVTRSEEFRKATGRGISPKRMKDQYALLRAMAFYMLFSRPGMMRDESNEQIEYKSDIDDFLAKVMVWFNRDDSKATVDELVLTFKDAFRRCHEVLGEDAFRFEPETPGAKRRAVNMPLFEVMSYIFTDPAVRDDVPMIKESLGNFKHELDSWLQEQGNVDTSKNVLWRYEQAGEFLSNL